LPVTGGLSTISDVGVFGAGADQLVAGNPITSNRIVVGTRTRISYLLQKKRVRIESGQSTTSVATTGRIGFRGKCGNLAT
jgi:hypothetical protein